MRKTDASMVALLQQSTGFRREPDFPLAAENMILPTFNGLYLHLLWAEFFCWEPPLKSILTASNHHNLGPSVQLVAGAGFEPATFGL